MMQQQLQPQARTSQDLGEKLHLPSLPLPQTSQAPTPRGTTEGLTPWDLGRPNLSVHQGAAVKPQTSQAPTPLGTAERLTPCQTPWDLGRPNLSVHQGAAVKDQEPEARRTKGLTTTNNDQRGEKSDSEKILQYLRELGKKVENLERKVNDIAHQIDGNERNIETVNKNVEGIERKREDKKENEKIECKFLLKGRDRVLKRHKLMSNGVTGLDHLLQNCGDEDKKEKLFRDWSEMHKQMERVTKVIEEISCVSMGKIEENGT